MHDTICCSISFLLANSDAALHAHKPPSQLQRFTSCTQTAYYFPFCHGQHRGKHLPMENFRIKLISRSAIAATFVRQSLGNSDFVHKVGSP